MVFEILIQKVKKKNLSYIIYPLCTRTSLPWHVALLQSNMFKKDKKRFQAAYHDKRTRCGVDEDEEGLFSRITPTVNTLLSSGQEAHVKKRSRILFVSWKGKPNNLVSLWGEREKNGEV